MYKICQTEPSARRQRELEQGLLQYMLRRQYELITVRDLCQELGIPRRSFYRYFSGKDGALYALIEHALQDYEQYSLGVAQEPGISVRQYVERMFLYWQGQRDLLDAMSRNDLGGVLVMRTVEYSRKNGTAPRILAREEVQLQQYGILFSVCGLMSIMLQWHRDGFHPNADRMADLSLRLLNNPLL